MLKNFRFPRPLQHKFEIKKEVLNSGDAENTKSSTEIEEVPKDEEAPEEADGKASSLQAECSAKTPQVLEYFKEKFFLLMCDKPLIRTEVCLNI